MSTRYANIDLSLAAEAARQYSDFSLERVRTIVNAVGRKAGELSEEMAAQAVQETGFGVVRDKVQKNLSFSEGFLENYGSLDFVSHRIDKQNSLILFPKPAGIIFALTPSTNPVATIYHKLLSALITRNAIVISPHPGALQTCLDVVDKLKNTAQANGLPEGTIQILTEPTIPLVDQIMSHPLIALVVATGGGAMVEAAYKSGTPAIGVGPGNAPALIDDSADLKVAAHSIISSKIFDNSVLCTAESGVIVTQSAAHELKDELQNGGAYFCDSEDKKKLQQYMYPNGKLNTAVVGKSAVHIAREASIQVPNDSKVLVVPIDEVNNEESFTHEKLSPVLSWRVAPTFQDAVKDAKQYLSIVGEGHSAVIHTADKQHVLDFSESMRVHRITVNAPGSLGNAGIGTHLPITMSVGTGFSGGSSSDTNFTPDQMVHWCRTSYPTSADVDLNDLEDRVPNGLDNISRQGSISESFDGDYLRRLILEELQGLIGEVSRG